METKFLIPAILSGKLLVFLVFQLVFQTKAVAQSPTISGFTPESGAIGSSVVITGTNFDPVATNNSVYFGAVKAPVIAATNTTLAVIVPTGVTYQPISVTTNGLTGYSNRPFIVTFPSCGYLSTNSFAPKTDHPTGDRPISTALGDFDGDGKVDLVVTNSNSNTISVFPNTSTVGAITLATKIDFQTDFSPVSVAVGDLNADGKLDLVVANSISNTVSIFKNVSNIGSIAFAPKTDLPTESTPYSVALNDLDGEGRTDLAVVNNRSNSVSIYRNIGTGADIYFAPKVDFATGLEPLSVAIGDLNSDSKPDLAVINAADLGVSVFKNTSSTGNISFDARINFGTPFNQGGGFNVPVRNVAIGDLNGDGKPDLALLNLFTISTRTGVFFRSLVILLENTSNGPNIAFNQIAGNSPSSSFYEFGSPEFPYATYLAISDLDGDAKADLAITRTNSIIALFKNTSALDTITFAAKVDYVTGEGSHSVAIGDLDGDGKPDLAVANSIANTISTLRNEVSCTTPPVCPGPTFLNNDQIVLNASCGKSDGNLSIIPRTGTAPFMYSKDGGANYVSGPNGGYTFDNLAAGVYQLRLKDATGCESAIVQREVFSVGCTTCTAPTFLNNDQIVLNANCGMSDGNLSIIPISGISPFMYSKDGGSTYVAGADGGYTFENLTSGLYQLRLKDATGCESVVVQREVQSIGCPSCTPPVFLNNDQIVLAASCGNNDGNISIIPTSGIAPFMYSINGGSTYIPGGDAGYTFENLTAGVYQLRLKDATGCESSVVQREVMNRNNCAGIAATSNLSEATLPTVNGIITTYPNPSRGQFKLQLQNFTSSKAEIVVFDSRGTVIHKRAINITGRSTFDFDLRGKVKGIYYIKIVSKNGFKFSKVVLQ